MDIGRNGLADVLAFSGSNQITENYNYKAQTGLLAGRCLCVAPWQWSIGHNLAR